MAADDIRIIGGVTIEVNENKLVVAASIIPVSIIGTLIRIGLERLEDYPGMPVFSLVYVQWIGCFIMGIATVNKTLLLQWYHPLHSAISTGLIGSITTFSSWQLDIFKEFANYNAYPHTTGKNILAALSQFLVTIAMSLNGLAFGQHVGNLILVKFGKEKQLRIIARGFSPKYHNIKDNLVVLFGVLSWVGVILAAIFTHNELAFACVFAPVGTLTRWFLSFYNGKLPHFPIGTWIANIFGSAVIAALTLAQSGTYLTSIDCTIIQSLADGYCGCLTTVSTFMVELTTLPKKHAYFYGIISVVVAQCFMFVILGSYIWSQGVNPSCGN